MKLFSKISIIIFITVALGLAAWSYPIIKVRYFTAEPEEIKQEKESEEILEENVSENDLGDETNLSEDEDEDFSNDPEIKNDNFVEILTKDCDNSCKDFTDQEDINYCKQVCGLTSLEKRESCDDLDALQKDYCIKDQAIEKLDSKLCEKIDDASIRKTCKNRITEELVDKQMENRL